MVKSVVPAFPSMSNALVPCIVTVLPSIPKAPDIAMSAVRCCIVRWAASRTNATSDAPDVPAGFDECLSAGRAITTPTATAAATMIPVAANPRAGALDPADRAGREGRPGTRRLAGWLLPGWRFPWRRAGALPPRREPGHGGRHLVLVGRRLVIAFEVTIADQLRRLPRGKVAFTV